MFAKAMSVIQRLFGIDPMLDYVGDVLTDVSRLQEIDHVGTLKIEREPSDADVHRYPPAGLPSEFDDDLPPATLTVTHRHSFMAPGDKGALGGFVQQTRGTSNLTPNRDGDLVIYAPHGGIDAGGLYIDGEPVVIFPAPPSSGSYFPRAVNGVIEWIEQAECS